VSWVQQGTLKQLRNSRYWAKKMGRPANAEYDVMVPSGPRPQTTEALVAGLERGLLITRLWYIRMLEPQTVTVTGLTRDGVWYVENGEIKYPVRNFRFNQSIVLMLAPGNVDLIGVPERVASSEGGTDPLLVPALRLNAFNFTSQSDAV
jgi:predicted Zn-dependent protease